MIRRCFTVDIIYSVPIIGHQVVTPVAVADDYGRYPLENGARHTLNEESSDCKYLVYLGKRYDVNYIYLFNPFGKIPLIQQCPLRPTLPELRTENQTAVVVPLDFSIHRLPLNVPRTCAALSCSSRVGGWTQPKEGASLTIDLGSCQRVTHIGTAGCLPDTERFPQKELTRRYRTKKRWRWPRKGSSDPDVFVHVVRDSSHLAWVTHYNLFFQTARTKEWRLVGAFQGNADSTSVNVHSLFHFSNSPDGDGLFTRYLRIQPTAFHNKPILRVEIFGLKRDREQTPPEQCVELKEYVLTKEIIPPHSKCRDNLSWRWEDYDRWDSKESRPARKQRMREIIRDGRGEAEEDARRKKDSIYKQLL